MVSRMTNTDYSEDTLVEQPAIALFSELRYDTANCCYEKVGTWDSTLGRAIVTTKTNNLTWEQYEQDRFQQS